MTMASLNSSGMTHRIPRRGFLQIGALGSLGLTWADALRSVAGNESPMGTARSAILIFLGGGQSHHDTLDPKPEAAVEIRGEFTAIQTSVPGIHFASSVPLLAERLTKFAVLRSVSHRDGAHEPGVAFMNTGYSFRPGHNFPGIGAVVGFERQQEFAGSGLPIFVGLPDGRGAGHLGPAFNPFTVPGDPNDSKFRVQDVALPDGLSLARVARRRQLAEQVSEDFRLSRVADVRTAVDRFTVQAYDMLTSPKAQAAFDLNQEADATRERYGRTQFGQRLLMARRLVEAGVPFVSATDFEWDDHSEIFPKLKQRLPVVDRGLSGLIDDLHERGLLSQTLVIVMGEFGRTPKINALRGRDHWPNSFSVLLAGGGVKGGLVLGASDADGAYVKERPITPEEVIHSIYMLLGIDPTKFLPSTSGREIQIVRDGKFISELTA